MTTTEIKYSNMKRLIITILTFFVAIQCFAQQNAGTYAFANANSFARVAALGGTSLPLYDSDLQIGLYNPSVITPDMHNKLSLTYVDYFSDINLATVQYSRTFNKAGSFMATVEYHNYGKFLETTESGVEGNRFSCNDFIITTGWGRQLGKNWSIGANLKFMGLQYESYHAGAIAVDVAGSFHTESGWVVSLAARNIGMQLYNNFDTRFSPVPFKLELGASKKLSHLPLTIIVIYDDIQKWNKVYDDPLHLNDKYDETTGQLKEEKKGVKFVKNLFSHIIIGGELNIGKHFTLRGAFNYGQRRLMNVPEARSLVGFSVGASVKIKMIEISYSRSRLSITNAPNYFTIGLNLNEMKKK